MEKANHFPATFEKKIYTPDLRGIFIPVIGIKIALLKYRRKHMGDYMLERYMQLLCKELEIEGSLGGQVPGTFIFPLEEDAIINITDRPPGFTLACNIGPSTKQNPEEFFTKLMLANLFGQGTKGAVLGLNEEGNLLTLTQTVDYNAEYKEFRDILEDFINTVDYWRDEIKNFK